MKRLALLAVVCASGCAVVPHAAVLGQTAAPLERGETQIAASIGVGYQQASQASPSPASVQTDSSAATVPALEANIATAIAEKVGFNLHLSEAGVLPGVKVTLVRAGSVDFAIQPELGGAYYYAHTQSGGMFSVNTGGGNGLLLVGLRAIVSVSLFYAAAGYHFMEEWVATSNNNNQGTSTAQFHSLLFNAGIDVALGAVRLRPEVAFVVSPAGSSHDQNGNTTENLRYEWTILPNLSVVVSTKPH